MPRPPITDRHHPVFEDARLEPLLDQADDAPVADPMLQEPDQPILADLVEGSVDRLAKADAGRAMTERGSMLKLDHLTIIAPSLRLSRLQPSGARRATA